MGKKFISIENEDNQVFGVFIAIDKITTVEYVGTFRDRDGDACYKYRIGLSSGDYVEGNDYENPVKFMRYITNTAKKG